MAERFSALVGKRAGCRTGEAQAEVGLGSE